MREPKVGCQSKGRLRDTLLEFERGVLLQALIENDAHLPRTANYLGVHRNTLATRCRACAISIEELRRNLHTAELVADRVTEKVRKERVA